jgi:hypothetical protein
MILNEQPSSDPDETDHDAHASNRAMFQQAYRGFLDRDPEEAEVDFYISHLEQGTPLTDLVGSIATSEEAQAVRGRRLSGWPGRDSAAVPLVDRGEERFTIRADDVLQTIAHVLALGGDTAPPFDDVMGKFYAFRDGVDLASIVRTAPHPSPSASITEDRQNIERVIRNLYRDALRRAASPEEVDHWYNEFAKSGRLSKIVIDIQESGEAEAIRAGANPENVSPGLLIQMAYEIVLGRGASAAEVDIFRERIRAGLSANDLLMSFFSDQLLLRLNPPEIMNDPGQTYLFGSRGVVDSSEWEIRPAGAAHNRSSGVLEPGSQFTMNRDAGCVVSVITSLYRGEDFIEAFLENITSQTIFRDYCELIIIDAASPENEGEAIVRFQRKYPNIVYRRMDSRIGIYEAWNIGASIATGRYLTNANLDDCRRKDSLEIQASILDSLPFIDVAYQDVLYSFEPNIDFERIKAHGLKTGLPVISRYNLMEFNSPHNGPMWRKSLHDDVGPFNQSYKSAADFDFWLRCQIRGKRFYKSNEAHVAYYVNPNGLSTRADTVGVVEANTISKSLYRQMVSPLLTMSDAEFLAEVRQVAPPAVEGGPRFDILQSALRELGSASRAGVKGSAK